MKLDKIIKDVFSESDYQLEPFHKGYTNKNYKLVINDKTYIVRVPWENSKHIVDHHHEAKTMEAIKDLQFDVPIVYFNEQTGIKISEYIDHQWEFQECPFPDKIERTAKMMKGLHAAKKNIHEEFDPIQRYLRYRHHLHHPFYDLRNQETVLLSIRQFSVPHVLCHNDWVSGNILLGEDKDYLIDYEYGANNDPLFDVASFLSENKVTDTTQRQRFYNSYFDEVNEPLLDRLQKWETFHNLLWCTWAMMMWEERHDPIYQSIAKDKYEALIK